MTWVSMPAGAMNEGGRVEKARAKAEPRGRTAARGGADARCAIIRQERLVRRACGDVRNAGPQNERTEAMDRKQGKKGTTGKVIGLGVLLLVALTLQNCGVI